MRGHGNAVHDAVACVPTAVRTRPIQQHLDAALDTVSDSSFATAGVTLFQGQQGEGSWHNPTARARIPRPAEFLGVEADASIGRAEFPLPDPARFTSLGA